MLRTCFPKTSNISIVAGFSKPEFTVKTTKENLNDAITGEGYEISTMYPEFLVIANDAGNQLSLVSLNYAYKTEKKHKVLYEKALAALESNSFSSLATVYYICPTCGNTYDKFRKVCKNIFNKFIGV